MASKGKPQSAIHNFTINQGDDFKFQIQVCTDDNTPIDISDYEFVCRVRETAEEEQIILEADYHIVQPKLGIVEFHFKDEDTSKIDTDGLDYSELNRYTYDVIQKDRQGNIIRLLNGYLFVSPGISWH